MTVPLCKCSSLPVPKKPLFPVAAQSPPRTDPSQRASEGQSRKPYAHQWAGASRPETRLQVLQRPHHAGWDLSTSCIFILKYMCACVPYIRTSSTINFTYLQDLELEYHNLKRPCWKCRLGKDNFIFYRGKQLFLDCLYIIIHCLIFKLLLTKVARLYVYLIVIVKPSFLKNSGQSGSQKNRPKDLTLQESIPKMKTVNKA